MPRERTPESMPPLLAGPLQWLVRQTLRFPRAILALCLAVTVVATGSACYRLGFRTNRLDLLNPASPYNQRWLRYLDEFGGDDDLVIAIRTDGSGPFASAATELAAELARHPERYSAVVYQRDFERIRRKGLYQLSPAELDLLWRAIAPSAAWAAGDWTTSNPEFLPQQVAAQLASADRVAPAAFADDTAARQLPKVLVSWATQIEAVALGTPRSAPPATQFEALLARFDELRPKLVTVADGRYALVVLRLVPANPDTPESRAAAITDLRAVIARVAARYPSVSIGLTGMPVLEDDEMRTSQADMTWASILSFLGVVVLLQVGFRRLRYTLLAVLVLVVGMAWSFGWITWTIGHLNLLSVSFAAILIGLGIDFGIHYLSRYLDFTSTGIRPRAALIRTAGELGPGIVTGAVTTAVAFFAAAHTDFTGVAELGLIAGAGVMLCLVAALVFLPPLALVVDRRWTARAPQNTPRCADWFARLYERPTILLVFLSAAGVAACGFGGLRYDHNLLNLQSDGLPSVDLERDLAEHARHSVWFAVSMTADRDELLRRKAAFLQLPTVARVEEISTLVPEPDPRRQGFVAQIDHVLASLPAEAPLLPAPSAERLQAEVRRLVAMLDQVPNAPEDLAAARDTLGRLATTLARSSPVELSLRLAAWRQDALTAQLATLRQLRELSFPEAPDWKDIPAELRSRFRGRSGQHLLRIYAREDVWDMEPLERFVEDLEYVDPNVTGHPVQTFYASRQIQTSYLHSGIYALLCVLIVLYLDFRHLGHCFLAMAPLMVCFLLTFGLSGWLRIPINAANLLALPLLLGIGIDNGVHVIHDWRNQSGPYRLTNAVALSIVLCSTTTMAGFGGLMIARHQGLRSLGLLLTLGMALGLLTSLLGLPAVLKLFEHRRVTRKS